MKIRTQPLCLIVETIRFVPQCFDGFTLGPIVLVRPGVSQGLLAHELTHVKQFWRRPFTHALRYQFSATYRQACEVEAYQAQLDANGWDADRVISLATALATKYRLGITNMEALSLLTAS